jgi:hypothetical protein
MHDDHQIWIYISLYLAYLCPCMGFALCTFLSRYRSRSSQPRSHVRCQNGLHFSKHAVFQYYKRHFFRKARRNQPEKSHTHRRDKHSFSFFPTPSSERYLPPLNLRFSLSPSRERRNNVPGGPRTKIHFVQTENRYVLPRMLELSGRQNHHQHRRVESVLQGGSQDLPPSVLSRNLGSEGLGEHAKINRLR